MPNEEVEQWLEQCLLDGVSTTPEGRLMEDADIPAHKRCEFLLTSSLTRHLHRTKWKLEFDRDTME